MQDLLAKVWVEGRWGPRREGHSEPAVFKTLSVTNCWKLDPGVSPDGAVLGMEV